MRRIESLEPRQLLTTFSNLAAITIPNGNEVPASPYPSNIVVAGELNFVSDVNVTLTNFQHARPDDVAVLLVSPSGASVLLLADTMDNNSGTFTITLDDAAATFLPDQNVPPMASGTFKPTLGTSSGGGSGFPGSLVAPAPIGPYSTLLSSLNGQAPNGTWSLYVFDDSNAATGSIAGGWSLELTTAAVVDLAVTKTESISTVVAGSGAGNLTHTVTVSNVGASNATGVTLSELITIPAGVTVDSITPSVGSYVGGLAGTWTLGSLAASSSATLTVVYTVGASTMIGTDIIGDTATISATNEVRINLGNDSDSEATSVTRGIDLVVTKTESIDPVVAGSGVGNLTHTVTVSNAGPSDASGVTLSELITIPAGVLVDSITPSVGSYLGGVAGTWTLGNLAASGSATLTIVYTVGAAAASGVDVISDTATITAANEPLINPADDSDSEATSVTRDVDLVVTKTESIDPVVAGSGVGNLTHTVTVSNSGPSNASGVTLSELITIPAGVLVDSITPSVGSYLGGVAGTWTLGSLAASGSATLTIVYTVGAAAASGVDVISDTASITAANETLINPGDDSDSEATSVTSTVDLIVTKTESIDPVVAGSGVGNLTHTVTVSNAGPSDASGVTLSELITIPAGVTVDSITPSVGSYVGGVAGTWTLGSLAASGSATLTIVYTVGAGVAPGVDVISDTASITAANETLINPGDDSDSEATSVTSTVDLIVTKTESADPVDSDGVPGNLTHTVTVTNAGPATATGVTLSEVITVPFGVSIDSITPSSGSYVSGAIGVWSLAPLLNGGSATLTIVYTVSILAAPGIDVISDTATVTAADQTLINLGDDSASVATSIEFCPPNVYVDDDWALLLMGTDPDGFGPATAIGLDAFATVQDGVDAVCNSGTVYVYAGPYPENVTITASMAVIGVPGTATGLEADDVLIDPAGGDVITITAPAGNVVLVNLTVTDAANGIVASSGNLTLVEILATNHAGTGLIVTSPGDLVIDGGTFDGIDVSGVNSATLVGGAITATDDVSIFSMNAVVIDTVLDTGSSTVDLRANTNGAGSDSFVMTPTAAILTTNDSPSAVSIRVNTLLGGTGDAVLGLLSAGTTAGPLGGRVTVQTAMGAVIDGNGAALNVVAGNAVLAGAGGVGTLGDAIETSLSNLEGAGGSGGFFVTNNTGLTIGGITGNPTAVGTSTGDITVLANGFLTVAAGVSVQSVGGDVDLRAGDDLTLEAGSLVEALAGTVFLKIDSGNTDPNGQTATINGLINSAGGATLLGDTDEDTIIVNAMGTGGLLLDGLEGNDDYVITYPDLPTMFGSPIVVCDSGSTLDDQVTVNGTNGVDELFVTTEDPPTTSFTEEISRGVLGSERIILCDTTDGLRLNALDEPDIVHAQPSLLFPIFLDGGDPCFGDPGVPPGDVLDFDPLGNTFSLVCGMISTDGGLPTPFFGIDFIDFESMTLAPLGAPPGGAPLVSTQLSKRAK